MNHNIASKTTHVPTVWTCDTCASCPKFKDFNESRGRGLCTIFDKIVFSHHPFTSDCKLNLAPVTKVKEETIDSVGQQLKQTRVLLDKAKHRCSRKNQLILKAPF